MVKVFERKKQMSWKVKHSDIIYSFLDFINKQTKDYVLKGGTSLYTCYNLDRFSEDIDLDSNNPNIEEYIKSFCDGQYEYNKKKDTDTTKRFAIHYRDDEYKKPLIIEISYRQKIDKADVTNINNIEVYKIDKLASMKALAYQGRNKLRDIYDLAFIVNNYFSELSEATLGTIRTVLEHKGLEHFDYMIMTADDELIDKDKLVTSFLQMYNKVDLLMTNEEKEIKESLSLESVAKKSKAASIEYNKDHPSQRGDMER